MVFRPLAGCGLFPSLEMQYCRYQEFPSPCGVWVVSTRQVNQMKTPSFRPLAGCGLFLCPPDDAGVPRRFRPLAGCGLFPSGRCLRHGLSGVSVPLRGVGCFTWVHRYCYRDKFPSPCGVWVVSAMAKHSSVSEGFRPLAGCGLFRRCSACATHSMQSFRPLAGCGLFL